LFEELEKIELAEDVFGTNLPVDLAFDNPREIVSYLALHLRGWGPNRVAADFLKQLATKRNNPALAHGLHNSWRKDQISAVIEEIFNISDLNAGGDDDSVIPVRKPRGPKTGGRAAAQSLDDDPSDRR
jgi:predicted MPP superfamily phosphohydrolase